MIGKRVTTSWASDGTVDVRGAGTLLEEAPDAARGLPRDDGWAGPRGRLEAHIEPFYPKSGRDRPYPLTVMPRVHCAQLFYNLSDPGMGDLLYEVESGRPERKR